MTKLGKMHDLQFSTADFETDPFKEWETPDQQRIPAVFACGIYHSGKHHIFWGANCLSRFIKKLTTIGGICYFHNGGNFDFHFLLPFIEPSRCEFLLIGKRIVQIKILTKSAKAKTGERKSKSRGAKKQEVILELRDSFALVPTALKHWDKGEIDIRKLEPKIREKHKKEIITYLKRDCSSLHDLVQNAQNRSQGDHLTQASSAFAKLKESIGEKLPRISERFDKRFRKFYYAGRVQCDRFGLIEGQWDVFDINSAFPHSMLSFHWWGNEYQQLSTLPEKDKEQCFIDITCDAKGCFPFREPNGVKVTYPTGRYRFQITGWEYVAALELGFISECELHTVYSPLEQLSYEDFILPLYEEKKSAEERKDAAARLFSKLEMNSSYGKFGQDPNNYTEVVCRKFGERMPPPWQHRMDDVENGFTFWSRPCFGDHNDKPKHYNNVCIAASITGKVRADLMRAKESTGAIYCDTDSIICPRGNGLRLPTGGNLGEWKHEFTFDRLWLGGKKLYVGYGFDPARPEEYGPIKWKKASKGVRLSPQSIIKVCEGEIIRSNFDAPSFSLLSGTRFISRRTRRMDLHEEM